MRLSPRRWAVLVSIGALVAGLGSSAFVYFAQPAAPARASMEVLAPGDVPVIRTQAAEPVDSPQRQGQLDSTIWIVLTAAFGAVAMSLFGGGLIAFLHQWRKSKEPARARWVPPDWYL